MRLLLPDYDNPHLRRTCCCAIITDPGIVFPKSDLCLETRVEDLREPIWVRLFVERHDDPEGVHFHIDTSRESEFSDESIPTETASFDDICSEVEKYLGRPLQATTIAECRVPIEEISSDSIVSTLLQIDTGQGDDRAFLSGATFTFTNGPVERIKWNTLRQEDDRVCVSLTTFASINTEVSESYLTENIEILLTAFRSFVGVK